MSNSLFWFHPCSELPQGPRVQQFVLVPPVHCPVVVDCPLQPTCPLAILITVDVEDDLLAAGAQGLWRDILPREVLLPQSHSLGRKRHLKLIFDIGEMAD